MKIVYLVTKRDGMSDAEFVEHWTTTHAGLAVDLPKLQAYSINLPSPEQRGPRPIDGYAMLKFPSWQDAKAAWASPAGQATAADGELFMAGTRAAIVQERPVVATDASDGIKIVYLVTKRDGMSDAEFVEHWTTTHAGLAVDLPKLQAYSINLPSPEQRGPRPIDGYAMLKFPSWQDAKAAWASPAGQATAADGELFMAGTRAAIVQELPVLGGDS